MMALPLSPPMFGPKRATRRAILCSVAALATRCEVAAAQGTRHPRQVLAFYYGWYGVEKPDRPWRHWQVDAHGVATNITDVPAQPLYDSLDPRVVQAQVDSALQSGITGFIASWWGPGSFEDRNLQVLLKSCDGTSFRVTAYLEKLEGETVDARANSAYQQLDYLLAHYADDPAWLRVDGRPVIFVYSRAADALPLEKWSSTLHAIKDGGKTPFIVGPTKGLIRSAVFDAVHDYTLAGSIEHMSPDQATVWAKERYSTIARTAQPGDLLCVTVMPGFDDRRPRDPLVRRQNGALYVALWSASLALQPDWVLVTTWNEWHEGTEIEPSTRYDAQYLSLTRKFAGTFLSNRRP